MATKGSKKGRSVEHEEYIAREYEGRRSASSGASIKDAGDVEAAQDVFECKTTGTPDKVAKLPAWVKTFEKVWKEAAEQGKRANLAFRFYEPESPLAKPSGNIDFIIRLVNDD